MPDHDEPLTRNEQRELAKKRRQFIIDSVKPPSGVVTDKEIQEEAVRSGFNWPCTAQSLKEDAEYFAQHHHPIDRPKGEGRFVARWTSLRSTFELRLGEAEGEKLAIGRLGASLVVGMNTLPEESDHPSSKAVMHTQEQIFALLDEECLGHPERKSANRRLQEKLNSYFSQSNRTIGVDAGTTTIRAIDALADENLVLIPHPHSRLNTLDVLTNCPHISRRLEDPANNIGVIMLGGRMRKQTVAAAGYLSELFLESWNPRLHMCLLGTTSLCNYRRQRGTGHALQLLGFHSDSAEESATKSAMLQRSAIRVILMDARKLEPERASVYPFAAIGGEHVDLVITDSAVAAEGNPHYRECVDKLWQAGTAVLSVRPAATGT